MRIDELLKEFKNLKEHSDTLVRSIAMSTKNFDHFIKPIVTVAKYFNKTHSLLGCIMDTYGVKIYADKHLPDNKIYLMDHKGDIIGVLEIEQ